MYTAQLLAAALAFASSSVAAPAPAAVVAPLVAAGSTLPQGGFTVAQVSGGAVIRNGAIEVQRTFRKFAKAVPLHIAAAAASAQAAAPTKVASTTWQNGSIQSSPSDSYDSEYICTVQIGSNGQKLRLDFDTGSSDLWVFYSGQPASQRTGHNYYTPSKSTSALKQSGETWNIGYGDGSGADGIIYSDKVVVGGATATSQAVECATSASSAFVQDTSSDGLLGLGWPNINTASPKKVTPFFQSIQSSLASPIFTAALKHQAPGTYDFGFINASKYTGAITYTPINTANGFWQFQFNNFAVGTGAKTSLANTDVICDTGTTLMYLPTSVVQAYYKKVSGASNSNAAGGYIFPCSSVLPDLSVYVSGVAHTVPGKFMNYAPYSGSMCFGGLQSDAGVGISILGDIFIKSQFVVFDVGNTRIGFAAQK